MLEGKNTKNVLWNEYFMCPRSSQKTSVLQDFPPTYVCSLLFVLLQFAKLPGASSSLPFPPAFSSPEWLSQSPLRGSACSSERSGIVGPVTPSLPERAYTPVSLPRELNIKWVEEGGGACLLLSPSLSIMHPSVVLAQWNLAERKDISRGGRRGGCCEGLDSGEQTVLERNCAAISRDIPPATNTRVRHHQSGWGWGSVAQFTLGLFSN